MLDFTSALYLGLRHESRSLPPWRQLTTGVPAALGVPRQVRATERRLAALQGCERATLGASTLHLCVDLFAQLAAAAPAIHVDAGAYAVARLGAELAGARGARVACFPRHDVAALRRRLASEPGWPVVVADGFTPGVGPAPVRRYLECVRAYGGLLVLDDTQALGVLGPAGGGSLRARGAAPPDAVLVCSLAKAFGAPVAALSGSERIVRGFEAASLTRVHCSPPSAAAVGAAARALEINATHGDLLRRRLAALVRRFLRGLAAAGLRACGGRFPVQVLELGDAAAAHRRLRRAGVDCVLRAGERGSPELAFLLTARHRAADVDRAVDVLAACSRSLA